MKLLFVRFFLCCAMLTIATPIFANSREQELIEHVKKCVVLAEQGNSRLTGAVLGIPGMSGAQGRHFLNNLCTLPNTSYFEVGVWQGSTFISALYGNEATVKYALGIDNWSLFGGPKGAFLSHLQTFLPQGLAHFIEQDCFTLDKQAAFPLPVNIYFYDGEHYAIDQEMSFTYFNDIFEDVFIAVIDDWNHPPAREGTFSAFNKLNYEILYENQIFCEYGTGWWNGVYIGVIKKPSR